MYQLVYLFLKYVNYEIQGITKETFPGFVKIWWLCFPLCLRLAGRAQKNVNKLTKSGKVSLVIPCMYFSLSLVTMVTA